MLLFLSLARPPRFKEIVSLLFSCFYAPNVYPPSDQALSESSGDALLGDLISERRRSGKSPREPLPTQ
jgi:hypothetical protein